MTLSEFSQYVSAKFFWWTYWTLRCGTNLTQTQTSCDCTWSFSTHSLTEIVVYSHYFSSTSISISVRLNFPCFLLKSLCFSASDIAEFSPPTVFYSKTFFIFLSKMRPIAMRQEIELSWLYLVQLTSQTAWLYGDQLLPTIRLFLYIYLHLIQFFTALS